MLGTHRNAEYSKQSVDAKTKKPRKKNTEKINVDFMLMRTTNLCTMKRRIELNYEKRMGK